MSSSTAAVTAAVTSVDAIVGDVIDIVEVLTITPGEVGNQKLTELHVLKARLNGRAVAEIVGDIVCTAVPAAAVATVAVIGAVPSTQTSSSHPDSLAKVLACGAAVCTFAVPGSSPSGTITLLPGISRVLKADASALLIGGPPVLYYTALSASSTATEVFVQVKYKVRLSGTSWVAPF